MPLCSAAVGSFTPPHFFEVTARRAIAYAAGLGDSHPSYLDDAAMQGIIAHPAFCVAVEWPVALELRQHPTLGGTAEERLRGVHAAQDSTFHRSIRPGDHLRTVGRIIGVRAIRPGAFVLIKHETIDDDTDEPVVTSYVSSIYRGVTVDGEDTQLEQAPSLSIPPIDRSNATAVAIPIARYAPHVYTECAQIWNPIHTERRVALAAGLPDIILHGTATWALAASALIQRCADGDPSRLRRFAGCFTAMVIPGSTITVNYDATLNGSVSVPYHVLNQDGAPAISHGMAVFDC